MMVHATVIYIIVIAPLKYLFLDQRQKVFFFALQCRSAGLSAMNNCAYRYSPKFEQRGTFEPRGLPAKPLAAGQ